MTFPSILFHNPDDGVRQQAPEAPDFFVDLNLDQVVAAIIAGKQEYNLKAFFYTALRDFDVIQYRHDVFGDLEDATLFRHVTTFADKLRAMREHLVQAEKLHYQYQKQRWFLDAVEIYCDAVTCLARDLAASHLSSRGFITFHEYLAAYVHSDAFVSLAADAHQLKSDLSGAKYCILIKGDSVRVRRYDGEPDYSATVTEIFEKFQQREAEKLTFKFSDWPEMNSVEIRILGRVAQLYPDLFARLGNYCTRHSDYLDQVIGVFDREVQFYVGYLDYLSGFKRAGLAFCYPQVSDQNKAIHSCRGFDLALAGKLLAERSSVVTNDFHLRGEERVFVVSGPNQGGKTTFARTFGQLHYLASLGCPVPGSEAHLFLFDNLFAHFEREEHIENLRGKLEDDLIRIHDVLTRATSKSIFIMNEIFSSTTSRDALVLGEQVLRKVMDLDALCVCVTFIGELASLSGKTVSMASTVEPDNPARRTYKVIRKPADGLAYALSIAEKYRLTYDALMERL